MKRFFKITARSLHLVAIFGLAGFLPGPCVFLTLSSAYGLHLMMLLLLATGLMMALIDGLSEPNYWIEVRGLALYVKLILVGLAFWQGVMLKESIITAILISGYISHAPGTIRYFQPWQALRNFKQPQS